LYTVGLAADLRVLYQLIFARTTDQDPAARLESFYRHQRGAYDDFRRRLLHGREEMMRSLDLPAGGRLIDFGGGTGSNVEVLGESLGRLHSVVIVDLCSSLLQVAAERIQRHGWCNVRTVLADATTYTPDDGPMDAATFSYSLTMIPDWFRAIDNAHAALKPGGMIGVVDFYVSRKWPANGLRKHSAFQRHFWPLWFSWDNVFFSCDHLPYLQSRFQTIRLEEGMGKVPYLFGLKAPYYIFLGRRGRIAAKP
jgi:S-adenosylmethionine-diacylgycerolhomoserine-N-methlytransferase